MRKITYVDTRTHILTYLKPPKTSSYNIRSYRKTDLLVRDNKARPRKSSASSVTQLRKVITARIKKKRPSVMCFWYRTDGECEPSKHNCWRFCLTVVIWVDKEFVIQLKGFTSIFGTTFYEYLLYIAKRFHFWIIRMNEKSTIRLFIGQLRKLNEHNNFCRQTKWIS